jgi:hypothetical protein
MIWSIWALRNEATVMAMRRKGKKQKRKTLHLSHMGDERRLSILFNYETLPILRVSVFFFYYFPIFFLTSPPVFYSSFSVYFPKKFSVFLYFPGFLKYTFCMARDEWSCRRGVATMV